MILTPTATILARDNFRSKHGKTAHGLIRYGQRYKILSVIDESCAGKDAGDMLGLGSMDIPIISEVPSDSEVLIIGVAPSGGMLPVKWREDIIRAIENGMDIVSGLHEFVGDDPKLASAAENAGVSIMDIRRPPVELFIAEGYQSKVPVVLSIGTDACVGKRTFALELMRSARNAGYDPGFIATGQTGIMIGCDAGVTVDSLPADFISGMVERCIKEVEELGKDIIFIEGQGALSHHAYGTSAHGILYGARPHGVVIAHAPYRKFRSSFSDIPIPSVGDEIKLLDSHLQSKFLGVGLNCSDNLELLECEKFIEKYEQMYNVPVQDVLKSGADRIFQNVKELLLND